MKVKEAIGLVQTLKEVLYDAYSIGKTYIGGTEGFEKNINDICALLQQGEKYRLILKALDKNCGHYLIGIKDNGEVGAGYTIRDLIDRLEQEYSSKEKAKTKSGECFYECTPQTAPHLKKVLFKEAKQDYPEGNE